MNAFLVTCSSPIVYFILLFLVNFVHYYIKGSFTVKSYLPLRAYINIHNSIMEQWITHTNYNITEEQESLAFFLFILCMACTLALIFTVPSARPTSAFIPKYPCYSRNSAEGEIVLLPSMSHWTIFILITSDSIYQLSCISFNLLLHQY